jgi:hypothetical protein
MPVSNFPNDINTVNLTTVNLTVTGIADIANLGVGNITLPNLQISQLVGTNNVKDLVSIPYSSNNISNNVAIRDASGNCAFNDITVEGDLIIDGNIDSNIIPLISSVSGNYIEVNDQLFALPNTPGKRFKVVHFTLLISPQNFTIASGSPHLEIRSDNDSQVIFSIPVSLLTANNLITPATTDVTSNFTYFTNGFDIGQGVKVAAANGTFGGGASLTCNVFYTTSNT